MVSVQSLSHTAMLVAVETLLQHPPEVYSWLIHRLHRLLESDYYSTVSGVVLERLCTYYPHKVTDQILLSLAPPNLHKLHLVGCDRVTSNGITKVLEKCQRLTWLCLQDCRCAGNLLCDFSFPSTDPCIMLGTIQQPEYNLTVLDLSRCDLVTDSTIKNILHHVKSLKQLHLIACSGITDEVFLLDEKRQLMRNEKNPQAYSCSLTAVDISSCNQLSSTAVRHLTTLCGPSLRCINIAATSADCTALLFLSGYSMLTSLQITKQTDLVTLPNLAMYEESMTSESQSKQHTTSKCESSGHDGPVAATGSEQKRSVSDTEPHKESKTVSEHKLDCASGSCVPTCSSCDTLLETNGAGATMQLQDHLCASYDFNPRFQVELMPVLNFKFAGDGDVSEWNCDSDKSIENLNLSGVCSKKTEFCSENKCSNSGSTTSSVPQHQLSSLSSSSAATEAPLSVMGNETVYPGSSVKLSSQPSLSSLSELGLPSAADVRLLDEQSLSSFDHSKPSMHSDHPAGTVRNVIPDSTPTEISMDSSTSGAYAPISIGAAAGVHEEEGSQFPNVDWQSSGLTMDNHSELDTSNQYPLVFTPSLEVIDLSYIELGDRDVASMCLHHLLKRNSNMQQLSLSWKELDDEILRNVIIENARQLKSLSLVDCQGLTTYGVAVLCDMCENLSALNLQGVNFIQDRGISGILANGHVTKLGLSETMITDYTLCKIAAMCSEKLIDLDLSWCEEITDEGVIQVALHCTNLRRCLLRRCPVTEEALHLVAKNCTNLRHLSISGINTLNNVHLMAMSVQLRHLEHLDIGWNLEVTDIGVAALLRYSHSLKTLIATGVKQITSKPFWPLVSDVQAFRRCRALLIMERKLRDEQKGTNCVIISSDEDDDNIFSIPLRSTCYAPNLNQLQLEWCDCVSDSDLAEIALVCRGSLHITDYYGIKVKPAIMVKIKSG